MYEAGPESNAQETKKGVGHLRVLKHKETGRKRIVVRTDGGSVLLNVAVAKEWSYKLRGGSRKTVVVPKFGEGGTVEGRGCLMVKEEKKAEELRDCLNEKD